MAQQAVPGQHLLQGGAGAALREEPAAPAAKAHSRRRLRSPSRRRRGGHGAVRALGWGPGRIVPLEGLPPPAARSGGKPGAAGSLPPTRRAGPLPAERPCPHARAGLCVLHEALLSSAGPPHGFGNRELVPTTSPRLPPSAPRHPPRLRGARCPLPSLQPPPQMERKGSTLPDPAQQHRTSKSHLADVPLQGQRAPWCQQVPGKSQILSLRRGCQRGATQTPHPAPAGTNAAAKRSPQGWSRAKLLDKTSVRPSVRPSQSCPCLCPISPLGSSSAGGAGREAGAAARCSRGCESICTAAAAGEGSPARPFPLPGWWWGLQGIFIIFWGGERMKGKLRKEPFPRSLWGGGISKSCHVSQEERGSVWCPPHTAAAAFGKGRGKVGRD